MRFLSFDRRLMNIVKWMRIKREIYEKKTKPYDRKWFIFSSPELFHIVNKKLMKFRRNDHLSSYVSRKKNTYFHLNDLFSHFYLYIISSWNKFWLQNSQLYCEKSTPTSVRFLSPIKSLWKLEDINIWKNDRRDIRVYAAFYKKRCVVHVFVSLNKIIEVAAIPTVVLHRNFYF